LTEDTIELTVDTRELEWALEQLSRRAAGKVMLDALQAGGNVMLEAVVTHTPERTDEETPEGTSLPPGILKADMHTQVGLSKKTGTGFVKVGPSKDIGGLVAYRQENGWTLREHGGARVRGQHKAIRDIPGKHFMATAFDESAEAAVDAFVDALGNLLGYGENSLPEGNSRDVEFG
jgi:hypothetical protein